MGTEPKQSNNFADELSDNLYKSLLSAALPLDRKVLKKYRVSRKKTAFYRALKIAIKNLQDSGELITLDQINSTNSKVKRSQFLEYIILGAAQQNSLVRSIKATINAAPANDQADTEKAVAEALEQALQDPKATPISVLYKGQRKALEILSSIAKRDGNLDLDKIYADAEEITIQGTKYFIEELDRKVTTWITNSTQKGHGPNSDNPTKLKRKHVKNPQTWQPKPANAANPTQRK